MILSAIFLLFVYSIQTMDAAAISSSTSSTAQNSTTPKMSMTTSVYSTTPKSSAASNSTDQETSTTTPKSSSTSESSSSNSTSKPSTTTSTFNSSQSPSSTTPKSSNTSDASGRQEKSTTPKSTSTSTSTSTTRSSTSRSTSTSRPTSSTTSKSSSTGSSTTPKSSSTSKSSTSHPSSTSQKSSSSTGSSSSRSTSGHSTSNPKSTSSTGSSSTTPKASSTSRPATSTTSKLSSSSSTGSSSTTPKSSSTGSSTTPKSSSPTSSSSRQASSTTPKSSSTSQSSTSRSSSTSHPTSTSPKSSSHQATSTSPKSSSSHPTSSTPKSTASTGSTSTTSKPSTSRSTSSSSSSRSTSTTSNSKSTSTSSPKTSTATTKPSPGRLLVRRRRSDPFVGGKPGNPGAEMHVSNKTIDKIHEYASEWLVDYMKNNMTLPDLNVAMSMSSNLIIKSPRISEAKFADFDKELIPTSRIRSKFFDAKIVADGEWEFTGGVDGRSSIFGRILGRAMHGKYRATITNGELEATSQVGRTFEAKPMVEMIDCRGNFSQFRVEIEGAGNTTMVENCDDPICRRVRSFYEEMTCRVFLKFIKEIINKNLATFPTLIDTYSQNHKINYALQMNEPRVSEIDIHAGLEGKSLWYGNGNVPFNAVELDFVERDRMSTFVLSDYSFNTLFHQSHTQRFQYSAAELLNSTTINDQLSLNCSSSSSKPGKPNRKYRIEMGSDGSVKSQCIGSIFDHSNDNDSSTSSSNVDPKIQYSSNDTGDLVYKSDQRAPTVIVGWKNGSYFDASNGFVEIYGPPIEGQNQNNNNRPLLGRAVVKVLRGEFVPKFNGVNITGSINITNFELAQSTQSGSLNDQCLKKLTRFARPLLTEMFNTFFVRYAQFSIPLLDGFKCVTPDFLIGSRSMQVDCDFGDKSVIIG